jgi:hypothetical protein
MRKRGEPVPDDEGNVPPSNESAPTDAAKPMPAAVVEGSAPTAASVAPADDPQPAGSSLVDRLLRRRR